MASKLRTDLQITDPDGFYEALIASHEGLTDAQSALLNAKLILLLANHIGDRQILDQALAAATKADEPAAEEIR